jgi:uncharacterized DUF497 family protein
VTPEEAEQLFKHDPYEQDFQEDDDDGHRFKLIGETDAGRILEMLVTPRGDALRVITAWDAPQNGKKAYLLNRLRDYGY